MSQNTQFSSVDVARVALWLKETKNGKPFLSGFVEFNDNTKVNVRIFKAEEKKSTNSPDYFGSGSVDEEEVGLEISLEEYEKRTFNQQKKPAAFRTSKQQPAKRSTKSRKQQLNEETYPEF